MNFETFNLAREQYMNQEEATALLTLDTIQDLDTRYIKDEVAGENGNLRYLDDLIHTRQDTIVGVFDCPYHPYLKLEYSKISEVEPTIKIEARFSNIRCVQQLESTAGISHDQVVAIFPENFRSISPTDKHPVYYFVNKFAQRHLKFTRPLLQSFRFNAFFQPLNQLSEQRIGQLIANWVNIHEASHRTGPMPIPQYLFEKSNRYTAALEELRADLNTISKCLSQSNDESRDEYLTGIYVLAERLLAYPLFRDKTNFDAISSVMMWKFLDEQKAFSTNLNSESILAVINHLILFIHQMELESLKEENLESRKQKLRSLVLDYVGNFEEQLIKYNNFWSHK